jgi:thioredoxin-related protein
MKRLSEVIISNSLFKMVKIKIPNYKPKNANIEDEEEHEDKHEVKRRYPASYSSSSSFSLSKPNSFVVGLLKMLIWPPERLR